ncbi:MAG: formylglycine-generating enzyme family protein [Puniceicoccaceae bacterium]
MDFVWIEPGSYSMGTPDSENSRGKDEGPQRKVILESGYYLGKYEVTQKQFETVMGYNPSTFQQQENHSDLPVETVSWLECQEFLRRLNLARNGLFRFPTEAEWEYACRAGTNTAFWWGNTTENWKAYDYAWVNSRSFAMTHSVGSKTPNAWGLHDMSGNVWEWCSDWYAPYSADAVENPKGPSHGYEKVFRGGSFYDFAVSARSGNRHRHEIDRGYPAIGLRVVWEPDVANNDNARVFYLEGNVPLEMVPIPAGQFLMGSPEKQEDSQKDEHPQQEVTISKPFYIGRFEVTQAQWSAVMGFNPSTFTQSVSSGLHPVEGVSWSDAMNFIEVLNEQLSGTFNLPTEAEWEYACRAGSNSRFPWGNDPHFKDLLKHAWFNSRAEGRTHPVGQKQPNKWGLHDMHGNVWEWCSDAFSTYTDSVEAGPSTKASTAPRIIRGGSWFNEPEALRSANRHRHPVDSRQTNLGFRVLWRPD